MENHIVIPFELINNKEYVSIPLSYSVNIDADTTTYDCKIDLLQGEIPEWLFPHTFVVKKTSRKGINHVSVFAEKFRTKDAALFASQIGDHLLVREKNK